MTWKIPATPKSALALKRELAKAPKFTRAEMMKLSQMSEDEAAASIWAQPLPTDKDR